jgi:hypothetical protein
MESDGQRMLHCVLLSSVCYQRLLPIKRPIYQKPLQNTILPNPTVCSLTKSTSDLDARLEPKIMEVKVVTQMIVPRVVRIVGINTNCNVTEKWIGMGAEAGGSLSTRVRDC